MYEQAGDCILSPLSCKMDQSESSAFILIKEGVEAEENKQTKKVSFLANNMEWMEYLMKFYRYGHTEPPTAYPAEVKPSTKLEHQHPTHVWLVLVHGRLC